MDVVPTETEFPLISLHLECRLLDHYNTASADGDSSLCYRKQGHCLKGTWAVGSITFTYQLHSQCGVTLHSGLHNHPCNLFLQRLGA